MGYHNDFSDFVIYGRWGPLDSLKIVSRDVGTFSTPGQTIARIFEKSIILASGRDPSQGGPSHRTPLLSYPLLSTAYLFLTSHFPHQRQARLRTGILAL